MHSADKIKLFKEELSWMKPETIVIAEHILAQAPEYFFQVEASASGKYHPAFANTKGGLVKHTKAAMHIAYLLWPILLEAEPFTQQDKDDVLLALMFHDVLKRGLSGVDHTIPEHPEESAMWLSNTVLKEFGFVPLNVVHLMATHMGQWGNTPWEEDKRIATLQQFVHMCDYISSQDSFMNKMCNVELFASVIPDPE